MAHVLTVVWFAGCSPLPTQSGYLFPTHPVSNQAPAALLIGALEAEDGCLYVRETPTSRFLIVWPDTYSLELDTSGAPWIAESGVNVVRVGDEVRLGGGETALPAEARRCGEPAWLATSAAPARP